MNDSWPCTHTHTHKTLLSVIHALLSRKVPKVNLGKVQSFLDGADWKFECVCVCVCVIQNSSWICAHTRTHARTHHTHTTHTPHTHHTHTRTHTHTHTYSMTKPPSLSGHSLHLPRQQCLSFVCLHFSLFYLLKKSCILFPQSKSSHKKEFTPTRDQQISRPLCACDLFKRSALPEKMHVTVRANPKIVSEILCLYSTGLWILAHTIYWPGQNLTNK